jgi:nucleoside-diphosphate-sugar epimerase
VVVALQPELTRLLSLGSSSPLAHSNGFVGSAVCRAAAAQGFAVTSLSRSGAPLSPLVGVAYETGDVFALQSSSGSLLSGAAAVISCIGGFGDNAAMERINGDANIAAVNAAKAAGVPRFVYVSVFQYNLPAFITDNIGYFVGKRKAEKAVLAAYGTDGTVLQPGFIYGDRVVGSNTLPLGTVGKPLEQILTGSLGKALKPLAAIPGSDVLLAPPVSVDDVASAAVRCATGQHPAGVYDIEGITRIAGTP